MDELVDRPLRRAIWTCAERPSHLIEYSVGLRWGWLLAFSIVPLDGYGELGRVLAVAVEAFFGKRFYCSTNFLAVVDRCGLFGLS